MRGMIRFVQLKNYIIMKNGIYTDLSIDDYHENKTHVSTSTLKKAKRSLKEFKWQRDGKLEQDRKSHFDFGNAFELALCEGIETLYKSCVFFSTEDRPEKEMTMASNKNKAWKAKIFSTDKLIINKRGPESLETIKEMLKSCKEDKTITNIIFDPEETIFQSSVFWTDKKTKLKLKTRPDLMQPRRSIVTDVKTTLDGSPTKFARDASNYDYYLQAVQQIDGIISAGIMPKIKNYFYLVVEKVAPYNATLYEIEDEDLVWLNDSYENLKKKVKTAMDKNEYKGYNHDSENKYGIMPIDIPLYYKNTY